MKNRMLLLAALAGVHWLVGVSGALAEPFYLKAKTLIDPLSGQAIASPIVAIEGDTILAVTAGGEVPEGARVIDLGDATLLPGLADLHTHLTYYASDEGYNALIVGIVDEAIRGVVNARNTLWAGFTAARNVGAEGFSDVAVRNAIDEGKIPGPRLIVSGPALGITGGHCDLNLLPKDYAYTAGGVADGPWEVRKKVRDNRKYGADLIKLCASGGVLSKGDAVGETQYTLEELRAITEEAQKLGMKVAAHAHGTQAIKLSIEAGIDSIEHASLIDDEGIRMAKAHGTFLVMDIYNTDFIQSEGAANGILPESLAKDRQVAGAQREGFAKAVKAGVKLGFGTDSGVYPHGDNAKQFAVMVRYGMTPMQAIQSATTLAAELLGWQGKTGAVAPGYFADIIAVRGDPLQDIAVLEHVFFVMKGGVVFKNE